MKGKTTTKKVWLEAGGYEVETVYWLDRGRGFVEVSRAEYLEVCPDKPIEGVPMVNGIGHSAWPQRSKALAVHKKQVKQANERNARLGLSTRYEQDGTAVIPTRGERARLCKAEGVFDNQAGYGDFAGDGPAAYKGRITGDEMPDFPLDVAVKPQ